MLCYENMNFPLIRLINHPFGAGPAALDAGSGGVAMSRMGRVTAHGAGEPQRPMEHGELNSTDLGSCHIPLQMWKQFSGRLRDFFLPKLHTPINIQQKCILSLFTYSLLNTIMVSSCIAGGSFH